MNIHERVTNQVLDLMEQHGTDWKRPWTSAGQPHNPITGNDYHGVNVLMMGVSAWVWGFEHGAWATYKQWQSVGAQVRRGEKSTYGLVYKKYEKDGEIKAFAGSFNVFNVAQVDGYELAIEEAGDAQAHETTDGFIKRTGAKIRFADEGAYYSPKQDIITMPAMDRFFTTDGYYGTLLHELTHWSGHSSRLDRLEHGRFGSESYAREELVAEIGSALLCVKLGVTAEPREDHAKYLNGWIRKLKETKTEFINAASRARAAAEYLEQL